MKRPSIHQLEVFCRVVQLDSMARAAEELRVAPSSVSMQVSELEKRYGTRLLIRGRRTVPTAAGTVLYNEVVALLQGLDAVEHELARLDEGESGTLRFATSRTIGASLVRPVLQAFECAHPLVDVSYLIMSSSETASAEVLAKRAEFALVGRVGISSSLQVTPLLNEPLVLAVSPQHPLARATGQTVECLAEQILLLREPPVLGHLRILRMLEKAGVRPQVVELGSTAAVKSAAVAGRGVAVLPRTAIAEEIKTGSLLHRPVAGFRPYRTVYLAHLARTPLSPVAESLVRLVRGSADSEAALPWSA